MTQPFRLKDKAANASVNKPPSLDMKLLVKRIVSHCIPCIRFKSKDEKMPLQPQNLVSNEYED
jgi:hypothetical protein